MFSSQQPTGRHRVAYIVCLNDTGNGIHVSLELLDQRVGRVSTEPDFT